MIGKIMSLALMAVLIFPPLAVAADPPDLKGRWIGKTHSIIAGKGSLADQLRHVREAASCGKGPRH